MLGNGHTAILNHTGEYMTDAARLIQPGEVELRQSEVVAALSVALDITEGQPRGHAMRSALVGMRLADELSLTAEDRAALFYALLLKDLGCSSNAAKMSYLFGADDQNLKRNTKTIDWTKAAQKFKYVWRQAAPGGSVLDKVLRIAALARSGPAGEKKIVEVRCERGAEIARALLLPEASAEAIRALDEHWNGQGHPFGLHGEMISLLGRICCLAQTVEVFFTAYGLTAAIDMAQDRRGTWFDPQLVDALVSIRGDNDFWNSLLAPDLFAELAPWEPADSVLLADEACLDRLSNAFARVVDAKSPWTYQHSTRVAEIAHGVAELLGATPEMQRDVRRAALLHDIGKLGVSNKVLDKPGRLTEDEFAQMKAHADYTQQILEQVGALGCMADVASAHHERLDGRGYHRGLHGEQLHWVSRVLAVADICEALSAKRPYRDGLDWQQIRDILARDVGVGLDADCFAALEDWVDRNSLSTRVDAQLREVDRLLAEMR